MYAKLGKYRKKGAWGLLRELTHSKFLDKTIRRVVTVDREI
jgi:hypothetical protein